MKKGNDRKIGMRYNEDMDSMLAGKIQQLMIFFSLLIPDMSNEEEQMLDEALIKTYGDLHKNLKENPMTQRIALDYVWDKVKSDRTKKKAIMIDEIWQLVRQSQPRRTYRTFSVWRMASTAGRL